MGRPAKEAAVAEISERFRAASAAILTDYRGLSVSQLSELRKALGATVTFSVVKNTLTKRAAREAGVDGVEELLVGPSAIAFVEGDAVEAAKGIRDFAKANPALIVKGGFMDGAVLTPAEFARIADLESRDVLLGRLAGALKAKQGQAAALFAAPLSKAVRTVAALRDQKPQESSTTTQESSDEPAASAEAESESSEG